MEILKTIRETAAEWIPSNTDSRAQWCREAVFNLCAEVDRLEKANAEALALIREQGALLEMDAGLLDLERGVALFLAAKLLEIGVMPNGDRRVLASHFEHPADWVLHARHVYRTKEAPHVG